MADVVFNSGKADLMSGEIDLNTHDMYVMLVTSTYVPNADTHTRRSDVTNEVTGTGYTAGGQALTTEAVTQDNTNDRALWGATNPVWDPATITARAAVVYRRVDGVAANDRLLLYLDFGADISSTDAAFTVQFNAAGIAALA